MWKQNFIPTTLSLLLIAILMGCESPAPNIVDIELPKQIKDHPSLLKDEESLTTADSTESAGDTTIDNNLSAEIYVEIIRPTFSLVTLEEPPQYTLCKVSTIDPATGKKKKIKQTEIVNNICHLTGLPELIYPIVTYFNPGTNKETDVITPFTKSNEVTKAKPPSEFRQLQTNILLKSVEHFIKTFKIYGIELPAEVITNATDILTDLRPEMLNDDDLGNDTLIESFAKAHAESKINEVEFLVNNNNWTSSRFELLKEVVGEQAQAVRDDWRLKKVGTIPNSYQTAILKQKLTNINREILIQKAHLTNDTVEKLIKEKQRKKDAVFSFINRRKS